MRPSHIICILTDERIHALRCDASGQVVGHGSMDHRLQDTLLGLEDVSPLTDGITSAISTLDGAADNILLIVPLNWCFWQELECPTRRSSPEGLKFELEAYLPLALEDVSCAFPRVGGKVLGLAIPTDPIRRLLDGLAQRGIHVQLIVADGVALAVALADGEGTGALVEDHRWCRAVTNNHDQGLQLVLLPAGKPQHPLETELQSRIFPDNIPKAWTRIDLRTIEDSVENSDLSSSLSKSLQPLVEAALRADEGANLARGTLAPRNRWQPIVRRAERCLVCASLLLLVVALSLHVRTRTLRDHASQVTRACGSLYEQVFPGSQPSPGAGMRLASERVRLEGLTRTTDVGPPTVTSLPLEILRGIVAELPPDVRVLLESARVEGRQVMLRGRTVEHRDAERIVEAVSRVPGLHPRPPQTNRIEAGGVEFSIVATSEGGG